MGLERESEAPTCLGTETWGRSRDFLVSLAPPARPSPDHIGLGQLSGSLSSILWVWSYFWGKWEGRPISPALPQLRLPEGPLIRASE